MKWISSWIEGIIAAIIIGTIIEMILPEGSSKKYIKVVIGVYILFSIVSPAISKVTGEHFEVIDIDKYVEASNSDTYENLNKNQDIQIRNIYESSLKNDMKEKIQAKGYKVIEITLGIKNDEQYTLETINLVLKKDREEKEDNNSNSSVNQIKSVNEINIQVDNKKNNNETQTAKESREENISDQEQKELTQYLSSVYQIEEKKININ